MCDDQWMEEPTRKRGNSFILSNEVTDPTAVRRSASFNHIGLQQNGSLYTQSQRESQNLRSVSDRSFLGGFLSPQSTSSKQPTLLGHTRASAKTALPSSPRPYLNFRTPDESFSSSSLPSANPMNGEHHNASGGRERSQTVSSPFIA